MSAASSAGGGGYRDREQRGGCGDTWSAGGGGYGGRGDLHDRARDQWGGGGDGWRRWWGSGDGSHNQPNHIAWRSPTLAAGRRQAPSNPALYSRQACSTQVSAQAPLLGADAPAAAPLQVPPPPQMPQMPLPPPPLTPPPPPLVQALPQMSPPLALPPPGHEPPLSSQLPVAASAHQSEFQFSSEFKLELGRIKVMAAPVGVERLSIAGLDCLPTPLLRIRLSAELNIKAVLSTGCAVGCGRSSKIGLTTSYHGTDSLHAREALVHRSLEFSQLECGPLPTAAKHAIPDIWPGCKHQTRAIFEIEVEGYAERSDSYTVVALLLGRDACFGPPASNNGEERKSASVSVGCAPEGAATRDSRASDEPAKNRASTCGSRRRSRSRSRTGMQIDEGNMAVSYGHTQSGQQCLVLRKPELVPEMIMQQVLQVCNATFGREFSTWLPSNKVWDASLNVDICTLTNMGQYDGLCVGAKGSNEKTTKRVIGIGGPARTWCKWRPTIGR